jgi:pimeloyl-ACP methyl ester carboxylesterase
VGRPRLALGRLLRRAPELQFLGVVSIAPGNSFLAAIAHVEHAPDFYELLGFVATSIKVSDPSFEYSELLGADLLPHISEMQTKCSPIFFEPLSAVVNPSYVNNPAIKAFAARNQPGQEITQAPILMITGGADKLVPVQSVNQLAKNLDAIGDNLTYQVFPNADHDTILEEGFDTVDGWISERFAAK